MYALQWVKQEKIDVKRIEKKRIRGKARDSVRARRVLIDQEK